MTLRIPEVREEAEFADDAAALNYTFHGITGVADLHAQGILGKGAVVAIVDSGVEWTHEALGGGIGEGFTVAGGYDLVGDGDWPTTAAEPDDLPNDQFGHGTHVAGIVAGKSKQFVGVAPEARILAYKVIGESGQSNEEMVIEGFLRAFDSGADIITASVGEKGGFTNNAWAVVASRMVDRGVFVTIAGGNDGEEGAFLMSNGAAGQHVMTVAASAPDVVPAYPFTAAFLSASSENKTEELGYSPAPGQNGPDLFPSSIAGWPVVPLSLDPGSGDACQPIATPPVLPSQSILLVRAGGCSLYQKRNNIAPLNATYVLLYQDGQSPFMAVPANSAGAPKIATIDAKAGEAIIHTIVEGGNVTVSFDQPSTRWVGMYDAASGRPAEFTQWGPNYDMELKPDIAAPGARVLSSYLGGGYKVLSGTSMATPYVAGVAALWVGQHGGRKSGNVDWAKQLAARIMSTAHPGHWVDGLSYDVVDEFLAPPVQMGAGNIHAGRLFAATTSLDFAGRKFALNDTANFQATHSVQLTNSGSAAETYTFSLEPAAAFDSWTPGTGDPTQPDFGKNTFKGYYDFKPQTLDPEAILPPPLTIAAGQTASAEFTFSPPTAGNASNIPLYGGRVVITATSTNQTFGIPYFGAAADIKSVVPGCFAYAAGMPSMVSGADGDGGTPISVKSNFTFDLARNLQDFPMLVVSSTYGAAEIRLDLYDAEMYPDMATDVDWEYPPVPGRRGYVGSATYWARSKESSYFDPSRDDENDVLPFPVLMLPRDMYKQYMWLGRLADGTKIQPGKYRMRVAALRPFGMRDVAADWDVWKAPVIEVLPLE
ncbi:peptidase S8/S53 domain-containing protein [Microdochium trichocladiopsis]|uniref:Peptidase S8/S53 domain-containing protein n=1 Tax=Microdochium trichocladiopsis TaxID=1682393 RepID=A0A9P8YF30_9PEZI|nr:peptidase S8/S53 domain-containing protein [Microdochium trichocladiopsis]KAH7035823.1 peptidase S8/S53 domain-containing protein [Microdochium trichocladiopsis]